MTDSSMTQEAMAKTGTKYKADPEMQMVLAALAALNGKPIETLDPAEARKQPTPMDAVMAVLKKTGPAHDAHCARPGRDQR